MHSKIRAPLKDVIVEKILFIRYNIHWLYPKLDFIESSGDICDTDTVPMFDEI